MTPSLIYQGSFWLLGFTVAFFAFVARDRRTPSVANAMYVAILVVFFASLFAIASSAIEESSAPVSIWLLRMAATLLTLGVVMILWRVWKVHHRHMHFRDDKLLRHIWILRWWAGRRSAKQYHDNGPDYRHNPTGITEPLLESIVGCRYLDGDKLRAAAERYNGTDLSLSIGCRASSLMKADEILLDLSTRFLEQPGCSVQYCTSVRHPYEFLLQLQRRWNRKSGRPMDWKQVASRIVAVDAYTPHFGFTDSIHAVFHHKAKLQSIAMVESPPTYAGVHTAAMRAFKQIQRSSKSAQVRHPTLVIYEGSHALVDIESSEQYRIFMRHVLPSERLWGGMLTLVVEAGAPQDALDTVKAYVDLYIDLDSLESDARPALVEAKS